MTIETLGVDIAKNVFQLHGVNRNGRVVMKRRVMRDQLLAVLAQIDPCTMVVEACTGAFYWAPAPDCNDAGGRPCPRSALAPYLAAS
jgi:transposase